MTTISRTAGQPVIQPAPMGGFFRLLGKWVSGIVNYLARRQAIQTLHELDDRALRDIGSIATGERSCAGALINPDFGRIM